MTPFMVVTRFLQGAVNELSHWMLPLFGMEIPIVASSAIALLVAGLIWQRHEFNLRRMLFALVVVAMIYFSHVVQDLYADFSFYDLQKNWHYAAYSTYIYVFFRTFNRWQMSKQKMVLYSFLSAIGLSLFDEIFQLHMSNRIFDVSDIAKDSWGAVMGLILVLFVSETYGGIEADYRKIWRSNFRDYFNDPFSTLLLVGLFSFLCILISPLLTDVKSIWYFVAGVFSLYVLLLFILHNLQFSRFRRIFVSLFAAGILSVAISYGIQSGRQITYNRYGLTFYKGLPVPFFDLLIYPNGFPRLVDKKHFFNLQDKQFLLKQEPDILLIGSGYQGKGGRGFAVAEGTYFVFNNYSKQGTQVIILPTHEACSEFDRLKKAGRKVLFVLHSTC